MKVNQTLLLVGGLVIALLLVVIAYLYSQTSVQPTIPNEQLVQQEVQRQLQALQTESARKAEEGAAQAANPFKTTNPLAGVELNPVEKAEKVLNPFD